MEITTDIQLKGPVWAETIDQLAPIFKTRTNYSIFMLSLSIGIMYDQRIKTFEGNEDIELAGDNQEDTTKSIAKSVPRNVIQNNDNGKLDFMFQAAIISTKTETYSDEDRLELDFGEGKDFNKIAFLTEFENFGVTKLAEQVGETIIESMDNIKCFLVSTVEGNNFDINAIPDDIWLEDY